MNEEKPSAPRSKARLYMALAAGGVLLLGCCICGGGGGIGYYVWSRSQPLVGRWEADDQIPGNKVKRELEFDVGDSGRLQVTIFKGLAGGRDNVIRSSFTYSFTRGNPSILELRKVRADGSIQKERMEVTFQADTMTLIRPEFRAKPGGTLTYRRVR